jgi:hypothetical protein
MCGMSNCYETVGVVSLVLELEMMDTQDLNIVVYFSSQMTFGSLRLLKISSVNTYRMHVVM